MPEHRHGMNDRPDMRALGRGRHRSGGWLFHMPGRSEFAFEATGERLHSDGEAILRPLGLSAAEASDLVAFPESLAERGAAAAGATAGPGFRGLSRD
jgi:hypothetical protein